MDEKIYVTRSSMPPIEEYIEKIKDLWNTHWLTNMGKYHKQFETQLLDYLEVENLSLFVNGHMALELALQAMKLTGEVITTPFTFASTTHAIVRNGLTPVFCDIREEDYTIDTEKLETLITDQTAAILPVHVYGNICQVNEIDRIAQKYNLKVIYDAAHAFGESYQGVAVGNFGNCSMFSFHATKVFNTIEGGAVCFRDEELGRLLYHLKNFGISSEDIVDGIGANAKMNEFQAVMGICNLNYVEEEINKRRVVAERYYERLGHIEGIKLNETSQDTKSNYAYFPVLFEEKVFGETRNEVYNRLKQNQIYARKYFYPLTSTFDCYHGDFQVENTPVALRVSKRILTLPIYADLALEDVDRICSIILEKQAGKVFFVK